MEAAGTLVVAAPSPGSILHHQSVLGNLGWLWGRFGCQKMTNVRPNSNSAEFHAKVILNYSSYVVIG